MCVLLPLHPLFFLLSPVYHRSTVDVDRHHRFLIPITVALHGAITAILVDSHNSYRTSRSSASGSGVRERCMDYGEFFRSAAEISVKYSEEIQCQFPRPSQSHGRIPEYRDLPII